MQLATYEQLLDSDVRLALNEGSMHFENNSAVHRTLRSIAKRLDELGVDYAIAGGMALFLHGFRRFTEDVDVLVTREGLQRVHEALEGQGYTRPFEASKNLRDTDTRVRIDFLIAGQFPGDGRPGPIAFPSPADAYEEIDGLKVLKRERLVELKLASGQASHRAGDLSDVQRLIQAVKLPIDFAERLHPSVRDAFLAKWNDAQIATREE